VAEKSIKQKEKQIMSTTITGKLNKAATQFQAGESTGFGLRLGVKYYDRETKADAYTNFDAVVFAKAPGQIQFYQSALIEGAIVEVSGDKLKIRQFQGNNGLSLSIELLDAKLGAVFAPQGQAPQQRQAQQPQQQPQQGYNQAPRPAPAQYNQQPAPQQPMHNQAQHPAQQPKYFDDDIRF
jgi:single-strand DNA-binding protein